MHQLDSVRQHPVHQRGKQLTKTQISVSQLHTAILSAMLKTKWKSPQVSDSANNIHTGVCEIDYLMPKLQLQGRICMSGLEWSIANFVASPVKHTTQCCYYWQLVEKQFKVCQQNLFTLQTIASFP
jgi:hypothetical protein